MRKIVDADPALDLDDKKVLACEFEDAVADVLVGKALRAIDLYGANTIVVGGGVSANRQLRKVLESKAAELGIVIHFPSKELTTDNAIMIALAGFYRAIREDIIEPDSLTANGNRSLA